MINYYNNDDIVLIRPSEILGVVCCALSKIDSRLMDHGERVAYIATRICSESRDRDDFDLSRLFILCLLHDIGAYKTNEIDDMVKFETETFLDHSLYGYLFLKNTTHLSEYAEAILYHHADYSAPDMKNCSHARYAEIIHLADRADILMSSGPHNLAAGAYFSPGKFNPVYIDALFKAEEKYQISDKISAGSYKEEAALFADSINIRAHEIMDYLKLLVYAIDFRSPYTVTHTTDTTIISIETGKLLGLSEHQLQALYIGAFLHDIGKIAIPHAILEKPERLTPDEFTVIKTHISEGEQILRGVVSDEICDIALRHHEKLDGSGYPLGLTGDELTLSQRIVAVADILSALSQRRSYKEPFAKEKVISILTEMKDSGQLCPAVVDAVCANYDMILNNTERSHDPVKVLYNNLLHEYVEKVNLLKKS